jgi:hypothetical protein
MLETLPLGKQVSGPRIEPKPLESEVGGVNRSVVTFVHTR